MSIFRDKLFRLGLLIRLPLLFVLGSSFLTALFIPFLDTSVRSFGANPWVLSPPAQFPYGTVLWALLAVPRWIAYSLFGEAALGTTAAGIFLVKAPLLAFDLLALRGLCRAFPDRRPRLLLFYWLNPILIYITYIHGQLDVAAMSLAILAIAFHSRDRWILSATALAAATLCKFHVVVLAPLFLIFIWNRNFVRTAAARLLSWSGVYIALCALGFVPLYRAGVLGYASGGSPEAFRIFAMQVKLSENDFLLPGVLLVFFVATRLILSTRITDRGLWLGCGALLASLVLATNPMPGWFFWFVPFVALLMSLYLNVPRSLYVALVVAYFAYFVVIPDTQLGLSSLIRGISLTALQGCTAACLIAFFVYGLRSDAPLFGRARPVMIGLSGDSGSGKDHLSVLLADLFGPKTTQIIQGDDYHKWERGHEAWAAYTHLSPKANHLDSMAHHTEELRRGGIVFQPHYDHATGQFTDPRPLYAAKTIIIQGLHALYLRGLRRDLDLKIFLEPDPRVRISWKIARDVVKRGRDRQQVLKNIEERAADAARHIGPQKRYADWWLEVTPSGNPTTAEIESGHAIPLRVRNHVWNDTSFTALTEAINATPGARSGIDADTDDLDRVVFWFEGELSRERIEIIAQTLFPHVRLLTRAWAPPRYAANLDGVFQLVTLTLLEQKLRRERPTV